MLVESNGMVIAIVVFVASIALIAWGRIHRAYIGLAASLILLALGIVPLHKVSEYVDVDVLGLLIGMAIITYYLEKSGFARWIASRFLRVFGRSPMNSLIALAYLGSLISLVLDNVSTTLLLAPVAIGIAESLGVSIVPYVIGVALGANLVGAALMVGDPPSMMVASALDLSFTDFILFQGKPSIFFIIMAACPIAALTLGVTAKRYIDGSRASMSARLDLNEYRMSDRGLFLTAMTVFLCVVVLLSVRNVYNIPLWMPPLLGGLLLLTIRAPCDKSLDPLLKGVSWKTLIFISSVFILTGGLVETSFLTILTLEVYELCKADALIASTLLIWLSVLLSAFIDNIPYFAMMIPTVMRLAEISGMNVYTLMWALLMGGSLGGNCTYIGASANAVAVGILEKRGHKVSFIEFSKIGAPYTVVAILVGEAIHYLIFIAFT
ncbi:MAG: SLC13 family permease [Candidatus Nezhaarchaeota archaeon]|nr:SLC13 family permease [Candidatus Nezhaarchaeota archaeon]MCX8141367.1 SLC13 family permease [Candidatus Nezhaarchaeota archaeon]MDW8049633.1 SLC13 family permease [Nitrososphaerota archaeon]